MDNILEVKSLRKAYKGFTLNDVSFHLPRGYIMGLIGPNGAGKTTIIKLIMNLVHKNGGEIRVFGRDHIEDEVAVKSRIGFVYDIPPLYEHLNLKQMKRIIAPFYDQWDEGVFNRYLKEFELEPKKKIKTLSRGMKMKFALAIALSHHADFIIMDEPTSGLDPVFRREFLEILSDLIQDEEKSVLFSTHITTDLERIADFITFIHKGEIIFSTSKDEVLENWGIVKAGKELLHEENRSFLKGYRKSEFGFEGLTDNMGEAAKRFGGDAVIERASLEDIMFLIGKGKKKDI
jgi:ABC-2 type transport system ATP-binding protein